MKTLQKGKKKRIRTAQERKSAPHQKTYEDDGDSDNPSIQLPVDGTEDAEITTDTPGTMIASDGHGGEPGGDNDDDDDDNDNGKISPSGPQSRPSDEEKESNNEQLQDSLGIDDYPPPSSEKISIGINSKKSLRHRLLGGGSVLSRMRRSQGQASHTDQTGGDDITSGPSTGGYVDPSRKDEDRLNDDTNKTENSKGNEDVNEK
jgi:hypothetical protein